MRPFDSRKTITASFRVQGAGEIAFSGRYYHLQRNKWIFTKNVQFGSYNYYNQPYFKQYNRSDFLNFSIPASAVNPTGIISEFFYTFPQSNVINVNIP